MHQERDMQEDDETEGEYLRNSDSESEKSPTAEQRSHEKSVCDVIHAHIIGFMHLLICCSHEHGTEEGCQGYRGFKFHGPNVPAKNQ